MTTIIYSRLSTPFECVPGIYFAQLKPSRMSRPHTGSVLSTESAVVPLRSHKQQCDIHDTVPRAPHELAKYDRMQGTGKGPAMCPAYS